MAEIFRHRDGRWPNLLAFTYTAGGYAAGMSLVLSESIPANGLGVLLLAHSMVIAAYLVHECAHNTLFTHSRHNAWMGELLNWLTGACYGRYDDIRHKHFRHHVERADVVAFDYRHRLAGHPLLTRCMAGLEWACIPAVDLLMHLLVLVLPFRMPGRADRRRRVILVLSSRLLLFGLLAAVSWRVLLLYPLAYLLFLHVLRFMDAHQHTYELIETLESPRQQPAPGRDPQYEQRHTFSNLISRRHPLLNLLVLNFGYHNAHHSRPATPWHRLPALHGELFGEETGPVLPFRNLVSAYHRYRVPRMLNETETDIGKGRTFVGVDGVSFLTAH